MDKSLSQSTISKSKPVNSSSESDNDCDKKCKKNTETIQSVHFKKIGKWIISRVLYLIVLSHSVWSAMKLWAKIRSPTSKGIICQNIQRVLKTKFPL